MEESLSPHFGGMVTFVKECELIIESGNSIEALKKHEGTVEGEGGGSGREGGGWGRL